MWATYKYGSHPSVRWNQLAERNIVRLDQNPVVRKVLVILSNRQILNIFSEFVQHTTAAAATTTTIAMATISFGLAYLLVQCKIFTARRYATRYMLLSCVYPSVCHKPALYQNG